MKSLFEKVFRYHLIRYIKGEENQMCEESYFILEDEGLVWNTVVIDTLNKKKSLTSLEKISKIKGFKFFIHSDEGQEWYKQYGKEAERQIFWQFFKMNDHPMVMD